MDTLGQFWVEINTAESQGAVAGSDWTLIKKA